MSEEYKFTYFNLRGVAEHIRLIFAYLRVPYEDNRINPADWSDQEKKNYFWGRVPILQIGNDKVLNQSNTIARYLAEKYNLVGENAWETAKMDEIVDMTYDIRTEYRQPFLESDEEKKNKMLQVFWETTAPRLFAKLEAEAAASEGPYLVGKKISWADFAVAHFFDIFTDQESSMDWSAYPNLHKVMKTVFEIPQVKKYVESRPKTPL